MDQRIFSLDLSTTCPLTYTTYFTVEKDCLRCAGLFGRMDQETNELAELLRIEYGLKISDFDSTFIQKTVARRLELLGIRSLGDYVIFLQSNSSEATTLKNSFYVSYSEFFRNPLTFSSLEQVLLPLLWSQKQKTGETELRIWSAACASGQEAYSLAILLSELKEHSAVKFNFRIFATDNNPGELAKAQKGVFHAASVQKVSLKRIQTYFVQKDDHFTISPQIKKMVDFSGFDLLSDQRSSPAASIYGNFDLVMCSNLLFYYKAAARKRILEKIGRTMAPGAYLITGETERDILIKNNYREFSEFSAIFQKRFGN